jgi:hypothetical protein
MWRGSKLCCQECPQDTALTEIGHGLGKDATAATDIQHSHAINQTL